MKYLFFNNTPAHVHLYKHAADRLDQRGHDVLVLARDYGCTEPLLEYYDLPYEIYGRCSTTKRSLFRELPRHYASAFRRAARFDPDYIFGIGGYAAHTGAVTRTPVVLIHDSEPTTLDHLVSRPFARYILTPYAFEKDLGAKHYRFQGLKESAYLHPDVFDPSGEVRDRLDLDPDEPFVLARFNAFGSSHDVGQGGFTPAQRRELVEQVSAYATVLVSDEGADTDLSGLDARRFDLHPALLHDALAEARLLVADSQTIVTEAALLGTPAIRSNSFVGEGDMGNFVELEQQGLVYNLRRFDSVLDTALRIVRDDDVERQWWEKRDAYVDDLVNVTDLITTIATDLDAVERDDRLWRRSAPG
jgi:hypothetical protein